MKGKLVALASVPMWVVSSTSLGGALILAAIEVALLLVLGLLLKRKPTLGGTGALAVLPVLAPAGGPAAAVTLGNAVSALVFYTFFLGLGEELLFRGYILSRLDRAYGRPFTLFGVSWGWGAVITSALFGLMHVLNVGGWPRRHGTSRPGGAFRHSLRGWC
jgi:uncharacterized protein